MAPKHKNNDAGNSHVLKGSHKVLPVREKVSTVQTLGYTEKDHIHVTFITAHCYNFIISYC